VKRLENAVLAPPIYVNSKGVVRKFLEYSVVGGLMYEGR
jgi:hypothetical protein